MASSRAVSESSSYESESDSISSESDSTSSSTDDSVDEDNVGQIRPYNFEPRYGANELDHENLLMEQQDEGNHRLQNLDWCLCENCQTMDREVECLCCRECNETVIKLQENITLLQNPSEFTCITEHPGFRSVCLDQWVLQVAWLAYKQTYENVYNGPQHKKYRHIAYRQYVRWVHGYVGKNIRVVVPSCAVSCIRAHFPPPGNEENFEFTGFLYPDL